MPKQYLHITPFLTGRLIRAYIEPLVMVFQEYAKTTTSTQTASLPPCIIGPCYHIVDPKADEIKALFGTYTERGIARGLFPNNYAGALIIEDSVTFRMKNAVVRITDTPITVKASEKNAATFEALTYPKDIEIGDIIAFYDITTQDSPVAVSGEFRVIGTNKDTYTVILNKTVPTISPLAMSVSRRVEEFDVTPKTAGITLDVTSERFDMTGIKYTLNGKQLAVVKAELYVGYKALRQDLSDIGTVYSVDEIFGALGTISPNNPLAFGVSIALANTVGGVHYVGIDSDDLVGYTAAKDRLENYDPVYSLVPLTMNAGVLSMYKNHAEQMSQPEVGMWRIALGCSELVTEKELCSGSGTLSEDGDGDLVVLTDAKASFLTSSVDAGDVLVLTDASGTDHEYTVASVVSDDILTVTQAAPFVAPFIKGSAYQYAIKHQLDKDAQAKAISATSKAYGSYRYVHVWPNICIVDGAELPGYYLACAVAGAIGGLQPHYGLTRLSISGISGLKNSGDYFNKTQLNTIAEGGTFIFCQASPSAPPHIRHQLTTDRSAIEFQELSFVKNFDYVSYICRDVLDQYLGKWNVTSSTMIAIETAVTGVMENLRLASVPKIGSPILGYTITSVQQLASSRDRIEIYCEVDFPYPLNTIGLHIISR